MPTFSSLLSALSYHDLRAIVTRLALRTDVQANKADWVMAIATYWQSMDAQRAIFSQLSPAAARALWWLSHAVVVPAVPF